MQATVPASFSPDNAGITLPAGFRAQVIAEDIGRARQIAIRENGDMYVSLMDPVDMNYVAAMRDTNGDGRMEFIKYFGELDSSCKGIVLYKGFMYVASCTQVVRFPMEENSLLPTGPFEVVVSGFVPQREHPHKVFTFDDQGHIYVQIGSPSNACMEQSRTKGSPGKMPCEELEYAAGIWRFDAQKLGQKHLVDGYRYATGLRNCIAMTWDPVKKDIYTVQNGRDQLSAFFPDLYDDQDNAETPAEEFQLVGEGSDFGWPYAYYHTRLGKRVVMPEYGGDGKREAPAGLYDEPIMIFPGHWAPVGLQFYHAEQFPERYRGGAFITFHGSWNRSPLPQQGYNVAFVPFEGKFPSGDYEIFADGFKGTDVLLSPAAARYRPTGVAVGPDGSLYVSEDMRGRIWKISHVGEGEGPMASIPAQTVRQVPAETTPSDFPLDPEGERLYQLHCLGCHQIDGSGVPGLQPPLERSDKLADNDDYLLKLVLEGSEWVEDRYYQNLMTGFSYLSDEDLSTVLNYVKMRFGDAPPTITPEDVARMRVQ